MEMTVTLNDKKVRRSVEDFVQYYVFETYSPEALKAAGVPKKAHLVDQLLADSDFVKGFKTFLTNYINDPDLFNDAVAESNSKLLDHVVKQCGAFDKVNIEKSEIDRAVDLLTRKGYVLQAPEGKAKKKAAKN